MTDEARIRWYRLSRARAFELADEWAEAAPTALAWLERRLEKSLIFDHRGAQEVWDWFRAWLDAPEGLDDRACRPVWRTSAGGPEAVRSLLDRDQVVGAEAVAHFTERCLLTAHPRLVRCLYLDSPPLREPTRDQNNPGLGVVSEPTNFADVWLYTADVVESLPRVLRARESDVDTWLADLIRQRCEGSPPFRDGTEENLRARVETPRGAEWDLMSGRSADVAWIVSLDEETSHTMQSVIEEFVADLGGLAGVDHAQQADRGVVHVEGPVTRAVIRRFVSDWWSSQVSP